MTGDGMVVTYTSGDADMMAMIQSCCDCMTMMMEGRVQLLHDDEQHAGLLEPTARRPR